MLFNVFRGKQILFFKTPQFRSVGRVVIKALVPVNYYKPLMLFLCFSTFLKYAQSLDFFFFKNIVNLKTTAVSIFFLTHTKSYFILLTFLKFNSAVNSPRFFSIDSFFFNFWWLEREASEMSGIFFINKFDKRNLLLEYLNYFKPMDRMFPAYGVYEVFFSLIYNFLLQKEVSVQL